MKKRSIYIQHFANPQSGELPILEIDGDDDAFNFESSPQRISLY